jgi:hypothetical protein
MRIVRIHARPLGWLKLMLRGLGDGYGSLRTALPLPR